MTAWLAAFCLLGQLPIRVTTELVEVNVVVRDKNGPVTGLEAKDFILRDRGRLQKIAVFRASSSTEHAMAAQSSGEFTNRASGLSRHAVVIVWDHLNTDFGDSKVARNHALQSLTQIQADDRVCLYVLDSELRVIQDFTSDSRLLVEALKNYREDRLARPVNVPLLAASPSGDPRVAELYASINAERLAKSAAYRATLTAGAVQAIANHLVSIPGRKSVIWIATEVPGAAAIFANAGIAVYPVDLSGTSASSPQRSQLERRIAQQSGGIAFVHNNVRAAIDQAVKDSEMNYTLGFYPDRPPDRMNALKIEITRKGLDAAYPSGYSGVARPQGSDLENALRSPLDATQISLDVRLRKLGEGWDLALELDPAELKFEAKEGRQSGGIEILLRQISREGLVLATTSNSAKFDLDPLEYLRFLNEKHEMNFVLPDPKPGLATLRLVVSDRVSGRVGSITIPIRQ